MRFAHRFGEFSTENSPRGIEMGIVYLNFISTKILRIFDFYF